MNRACAVALAAALTACGGGQGYHWVKGLGPDGARGATASHVLHPASEGFFLPTPDGQASIQFPRGAVALREPELLYVTTIEPLDPKTLGSAPAGYAFAGNAYAVASTYLASKAPVALTARSCVRTGALDPCPVLTLTTPGRADALLRWDGRAWVVVGDARFVGENKTFIASVGQLGTFAGATKA